MYNILIMILFSAWGVRNSVTRAGGLMALGAKYHEWLHSESRFQYPLTMQYTSNYSRTPNMI